MRFYNFITIVYSRCGYFCQIKHETTDCEIIFWNCFKKSWHCMFDQMSNTLVPMTILVGFWMSAPRQSRYFVYRTPTMKTLSIADSQARKLEAGNFNILFSLWCLCPAHLQIYSPKDFSDIILFVGGNDLYFCQKTNCDICKISGSRDYRSCQPLVPPCQSSLRSWHTWTKRK